MAGLSIHMVVYAVVNAALIGLWLVLGGTTDELQEAWRSPLDAIRDGFWPGWVLAAWGVGLALHTGIWLSLALFGGRARRQRRALVAKAMALHQQRHGYGHHPGRHDGRRAAASTGKRWVAAMFTDIASSTSLAETLGDEAWHQVLVEHRDLVRRCVAESDGVEVGTQGDGFLVQFDSPSAAVACAAAVQRRLTQARRSGSFVPKVRIGIHAGEAMRDESDLVGRVVNLAARVTAAAEPDEILVTEPVADHVPASVQLVDRGLQALRGVAQPRHLLAVRWDHPTGTGPAEADDIVTTVPDDGTGSARD